MTETPKVRYLNYMKLIIMAEYFIIILSAISAYRLEQEFIK